MKARRLTMAPGVGRDVERSADEWFVEATRWYLEGHQGCARCHRQHCVFRSEWGLRVEYHCTACDFSAGHDTQTGLSCASMGEPPARGGVLLCAEEWWELAGGGADAVGL